MAFDINRRSFLRGAASIIGTGFLPWRVVAGTSRPESNPNFVVIVADDLGWTDTACYLSFARGVARSKSYYETPNIDKLADSGVMFTQAYACPLCSPSRASLLTGQYAAENGFIAAHSTGFPTYYNRGKTPPEDYHPQDSLAATRQKTSKPYMPLLSSSTQTALLSDAVTIAETLSDYESVFLGKWHIGGHGAGGYQPGDQGFKELAYFDSHASDYFNWRDDWDSKNPYHKGIRGNAGEKTDCEYLTDDTTEQALRYLETRSVKDDKPFLMYLCHFAVHSPWQGKKEYVRYFAQKQNRGFNGQDNPVYAAMIKSLDDSVGKIVDKLDAKGLSDNTVVVFISDNGGLLQTKKADGIENITSNAPLRGGKAMVYEGGIRVPFVMKRPGHIKAGQICDRPVDINDLYPTLADLAGVELSAYREKRKGDGQSVLSLIEGTHTITEQYDRDTFFWHFPYYVGVIPDAPALPPMSAVRKGDYKLIWNHHGYLELYDLKEDIAETTDISEKFPDRAIEMFELLESWIKENVEPRYQTSPNPEFDPEEPSPYRPVRDRSNMIAELNTKIES
jgi:arylsulfatase A-like enzyme